MTQVLPLGIHCHRWFSDFTRGNKCQASLIVSLYNLAIPTSGSTLKRKHLLQEKQIYLLLKKTFEQIFLLLKTKNQKKLENVFVKHYAPNHMPDPKGEWSLKENNSELHYGICSKVYQFIYTLVCNYMPIMRILAKGVLQISRSKGCSYTKCLC